MYTSFALIHNVYTKQTNRIDLVRRVAHRLILLDVMMRRHLRCSSSSSRSLLPFDLEAYRAQGISIKRH